MLKPKPWPQAWATRSGFHPHQLSLILHSSFVFVSHGLSTNSVPWTAPFQCFSWFPWPSDLASAFRIPFKPTLHGLVKCGNNTLNKDNFKNPRKTTQNEKKKTKPKNSFQYYPPDKTIYYSYCSKFWVMKGWRTVGLLWGKTPQQTVFE